MSTPIVPPGVDIHASRKPQLYAATIVTWSLASIAVALRFWSRRLVKTKYWLDDWLALSALAVATALFIDTLVWINAELGRHFEVLELSFATTFFKNLFVGEILYTLIIVLVKYCILSFYWRIFAAAHLIRIPIFTLTGITTAWGIATILVSIFQCNPVSSFWNRNPNKPSNCTIDDYAFFVGIAVPNIITDAALLSVPIPFIWRLHRDRPQKFALAGMFMLGGFVTIISIVRLSALVSVDLTSPDLTWNFSYVSIWTITESNMAIVSGCLPSLRPIYSLLLTGSPMPSTRATSQQYINSRDSRGKRKVLSSTRQFSDQSSITDSQHNFVPISDNAQPYSGGSESYATHIAGNRDISPEDIEMQNPSQSGGGIKVRSDVAVKWTADGS